MKILLKKCSVYSLLLLCTIIQAQNTETVLSGNVTDTQNNPIEFAHLELVGSKAKTISDENGFYKFVNPTAGTFLLRVSYMGKDTFTKRVQIIKDSANQLDIELINKEENLDEVVITGDKMPAIAKANSEYVARLPISNIENPQVYITVSQDLMEAQSVTDLDGALKNVVGAGVPVRFDQNRITFLSRGFQVEPKIRNGLTTFNQNALDPVNLERIEVLKGPSATLFGSSEVSYGGLLNRVTKKPHDNFGGAVAYNGGSWNLNRLTFDVNTPVNSSKSLLFRVNGAVHGEKSFQDAGFFNNTAFTPSLTYTLSANTTLHFDLEYTKSKGTSPVRHNPDTGDLSERSAEDFLAYYNTSYTSNDIFYETENIDIFGEIRHKLSDTWTSSTSFARTSVFHDGYTSRIDGRSENTFRARVNSGYYGYNSTNIQQNFTGEFNLGSLKNRMVVGVNYYNYHQDRDISYINTSEFEYGSADYYNEFNKAYIDAEMSNGTRTLRNQTTNTYSAYVSDVINISDRLLAMLSLRFDRFNDEGTNNMLTGESDGTYNQNALSPKLGLVYEVIPDQVSAFGNYMNGFTNQNGTGADGDSFDPEHANQFEGGLKFNVLKHKISGSISYYNIDVKNIVREDPDDSDFDIQDGGQTSKGIEVEFIANPLPQLNLIFGYAYNKSELQNTEDGAEDGLRPASAGPESLVNWWLDYTVPLKHKNNLVFGLGGNYGSSSFQTNTVDATVTIPSYTVLDFGVTYHVNRFSLGVKLNNLTDETYWSYRLAPQKPRHLVANLGFKF